MDRKMLDVLVENFKPDNERIYKVMSNLSDAIDQIKYDKRIKERYNTPFYLVIESVDKEEPLVAMEIKRYFGGTYKTFHNSNRYNLRQMKKLYNYGGNGSKIYLIKGM